MRANLSLHTGPSLRWHVWLECTTVEKEQEEEEGMMREKGMRREEMRRGEEIESK